jgi:hypothetical protein
LEQNVAAAAVQLSADQIATLTAYDATVSG